MYIVNCVRILTVVRIFNLYLEQQLSFWIREKYIGYRRNLLDIISIMLHTKCMLTLRLCKDEHK